MRVATHMEAGVVARSLDPVELQQGSPSNLVVEGSTTRVGVSEIRYAFPAPTGMQIQNVLDSSWWTVANTPGYILTPGPRTIFAYLTTDI
ncbi:MAG: hypothetical protein WAU49_11095 [Steroidobacteraceae bacterium]